MSLDDTETSLPNIPCPGGCGYVMDATTGLDGASTPGEGDISICLRCGHVSEFKLDAGSIRLESIDATTLPEDLQKYLKKVEAARSEVMSRKTGSTPV